jgi:hypothetical protein
MKLGLKIMSLVTYRDKRFRKLIVGRVKENNETDQGLLVEKTGCVRRVL